MADENEIVDTSNEEVSKEIKERIEKNKERALLLRKAKIVAHPYAKK